MNKLLSIWFWVAVVIMFLGVESGVASNLLHIAHVLVALFVNVACNKDFFLTNK